VTTVTEPATVTTTATVTEPAAPTTAVAPPCLERAASVVRPGIDAAILRLNPKIRPLVRHHLDGGKHVRAALTLVSAAACGADDHVAVPGGVAIELVHNFSLLHDDIIDGDEERRHRPTAWKLFGTGNAIIGGDALSTLAMQVLLIEPSARHAEAARLLVEATQEMITGQIDDMTMSELASVSVADCLTMTQAKTGALLSCAAEIGAVLAGAAPKVRSALASFGGHLGIAFQGIDDLLGIWGDPAVTGKPVGNDLLARKKSLPVAIAMGKRDAAARELVRLLEGRLGADEVATATRILERCGAREEVAALAASHYGAALECLDRAPMEEHARSELAAVAGYVTARDR